MYFTSFNKSIELCHFQLVPTFHAHSYFTMSTLDTFSYICTLPSRWVFFPPIFLYFTMVVNFCQENTFCIETCFFQVFHQRNHCFRQLINILGIGLWTWKMSKGELLTYQFCHLSKTNCFNFIMLDLSTFYHSMQWKSNKRHKFEFECFWGLWPNMVYHLFICTSCNLQFKSRGSILDWLQVVPSPMQTSSPNGPEWLQPPWLHQLGFHHFGMKPNSNIHWGGRVYLWSKENKWSSKNKIDVHFL